MNRKVNVNILRLTDQEYSELESIIQRYNHSLEKSRARAREKRESSEKVIRAPSYKKKAINLDYFLTGQELMGKDDLQRLREELNSENSLEDQIDSEK